MTGRAPTPNGPVARMLKALMERPMTGPELQEVIEDSCGAVASVANSQKAQGNMTRIDGRSGKGYVATWALTEKGKEKALGLPAR